MSKLSRKEFKELLLEWNENFINEADTPEVISEGFLSKAFLPLAISALGHFASIPVVNAKPIGMEKIMSVMSGYGDEVSPGQYSFYISEEDGALYCIDNYANEPAVLVLTAKASKSLSRAEFRKVLKILKNALNDGTSLKDLKGKLHNLTGADKSSIDSKSKSNTGLIQSAESIKALSKSDKEKLISEFEGDDSEFNFGRAHLAMAAQSVFNKNSEIKEIFESEENYYIYLIVKKYPSFTKYLNKK